MISVKLKNCLGTTGKYLWRSAAYEKSWDDDERDCGVMRTSKTTVKNQLRDARKRLKESLDIQNDFLNLS